MDAAFQPRDLAVDRADQILVTTRPGCDSRQEVDAVEPTGTGHTPQVLHGRMQTMLWPALLSLALSSRCGCTPTWPGTAPARAAPATRAARSTPPAVCATASGRSAPGSRDSRSSPAGPPTTAQPGRVHQPHRRPSPGAHRRPSTSRRSPRSPPPGSVRVDQRRRQANGSLSIWVTPTSSPASSSRTINDRCACRSTATYCRSTSPLLARGLDGLPTSSLLLDRPRAGEDDFFDTTSHTRLQQPAATRNRSSSPSARARQPLCHAITYRMGRGGESLP